MANTSWAIKCYRKAHPYEMPEISARQNEIIKSVIFSENEHTTFVNN